MTNTGRCTLNSQKYTPAAVHSDFEPMFVYKWGSQTLFDIFHFSNPHGPGPYSTSASLVGGRLKIKKIENIVYSSKQYIGRIVYVLTNIISLPKFFKLVVLICYL